MQTQLEACAAELLASMAWHPDWGANNTLPWADC